MGILMFLLQDLRFILFGKLACLMVYIKYLPYVYVQDWCTWKSIFHVGITHYFLFQLNCIVVPTKALADPSELDKALADSLTSGMVASAAAAARNFAQVFWQHRINWWPISNVSILWINFIYLLHFRIMKNHLWKVPNLVKLLKVQQLIPTLPQLCQYQEHQHLVLSQVNS